MTTNGVVDSSIHKTLISNMSEQIFVCNWKGKTITIDIEPKEQVQHLKNKITEIEGYASSSQRLIFAGKLIEDSITLEHCSIHKQNTIHCVGTFG
eukprot:364108_1